MKQRRSAVNIPNGNKRAEIVGGMKCVPFSCTLVTLVKLHDSFPTFVFIFSRVYAAKACIAGTYMVAVQSGVYAPCYRDAHRRVTRPLWLKIGKLAASELCEYFVFSGIRAFTRELSAIPFRIPILSSRISGEARKSFRR